MRSFENLEQKTDEFVDTISVYTLLQKLDPSNKVWFEREFGKYNDTNLIDFLKKLCKNIRCIEKF